VQQTWSLKEADVQPVTTAAVGKFSLANKFFMNFCLTDQQSELFVP
jgi:hypothetical protein